MVDLGLSSSSSSTSSPVRLYDLFSTFTVPKNMSFMKSVRSATCWGLLRRTSAATTGCCCLISCCMAKSGPPFLVSLPNLLLSMAVNFSAQSGLSCVGVGDLYINTECFRWIGHGESTKESLNVLAGIFRSLSLALYLWGVYNMYAKLCWQNYLRICLIQTLFFIGSLISYYFINHAQNTSKE